MMDEFEEKVKGTLLFMESVSKRELAEFIVRQNEAVDGLGKNLKAYVKVFREVYDQRTRQTANSLPVPPKGGTGAARWEGNEE